MLVKGEITVNNTAAVGADEKLIFKNSAPFTDCIIQINYTEADNAKYIDIVMPMYKLVEYRDNYSKTSRSLWKYCKDIPAVYDDDNINFILMGYPH